MTSYSEYDRLAELLHMHHKAYEVQPPCETCRVQANNAINVGGVRVEVPEPEPVKPGTTGTATVEEFGRVHGFVSRGFYSPVLNDSPEPEFYFVAPSGYQSRRPLSDVTDFVADPEPLTVEVVDRLGRQVGSYGAGFNSQLESIVRKALAPYVAGGAR
jgi:hypothetical protein